MRIIKFRVWNNKTKKWIHGPNENPSLDGCNLFGECILLGEFMCVSLDELNDCVPLQFTGLKDKNGKEIFEGDIVKDLDSDKGVIQFDNGSFIVKSNIVIPFWSVLEINGAVCPRILKSDAFEIIGNIYESPELLK